MKILKESIDHKKREGDVEIIPESPDDIYILYNFLEPKDIIKTMTTRKINIEGKDSKKVTLLMDLSIQEMDADLQSNHIFIKGVTVSQHENIRQGSFHSFDISIGKRIKVIKNYWSNCSLKVLKEMKKIIHNVLICIFYESECLIFNVTRNFVKLIQKLFIKGKNIKPFVDYIGKHVSEIKAVVLCTFKEEKPSLLQQLTKVKEFSKYINLFCEVKLEENKKKVVPTKLVSLILTDDRNKGLIEKIELQQESNEMKTFLKNLEFDPSRTSIGPSEIEEALEYGAVDILLVTFERYKNVNIEERRKIERLMESVSKMRGSVCFLPETSVYGEKLAEIGGLAANLKFTYK